MEFDYILRFKSFRLDYIAVYNRLKKVRLDLIKLDWTDVWH